MLYLYIPAWKFLDLALALVLLVFSLLRSSGEHGLKMISIIVSQHWNKHLRWKRAIASGR